MRIAIISTPFVAVPPTNYGGTELVVHELAEGMVERGHDVTLYATGDSRTHAKLRALYDRVQWPPEMLSDLDHVSWAMAEAVADGANVIHANSAVALAVGRCIRPDIPLIYTLHHARDEAFSSFYPHFPEAWYVAISDDQRQREIPIPKIRVIHHGLDTHRYEWTDRAADYVAFVGRFARVKGPHTAIDAAAMAGLEIRVAGEVHDVDRKFGAAEVEPRLALPHVTYLGLIGTDKKVPLLRDARALLVPIEWNEPFGLILIEAMLSGCPVVAFPRGSVRELVEPGVTGFIVEDVNELSRVIRPGGPLDQFDRLRCRQRAVERFSRDRMVADHERLYLDAIEAVTPPGPLRMRIA